MSNDPRDTPENRAAHAAPHADWTPEKHLSNLLGICEAQMEAAMRESDRAVDALVQAFSCLADSAQTVGNLAGNLPNQEQAAAIAGLGKQCEVIKEQMSAAIVAFQFYDKLSQRLQHVRYSLNTLSEFVCDPSQASRREHWQRLVRILRRQYRTAEERQLFELLEGDAWAEATLVQQIPSASNPGSVELF